MNLTLRAVCATFSLLLGTCALGNFTQRSATNAALIAANDLFPLQGHLGTSLGALDANGNVAEQSGADAFGVLDGTASPSVIKLGKVIKNQSLRKYLKEGADLGRISFEQAHRIGLEIWVRAEANPGVKLTFNQIRGIVKDVVP